MLTENEKTRIEELMRQGLKYPTIAKITGIKLSSVRYYCGIADAGDADARKADAFCKGCGRPLFRKEKSKPRRFCSDACRMKWWNGHRDEVKHKTESRFICEYCGAAFTRPGKTRHRFCSKKCSAEARKKAAE